MPISPIRPSSGVRRLALWWGVIPRIANCSRDDEQLIAWVDEHLRGGTGAAGRRGRDYGRDARRGRRSH